MTTLEKCPECNSMDFEVQTGGIDKFNKRTCWCGAKWYPKLDDKSYITLVRKTDTPYL